MYVHMWSDGIHVVAGDRVIAGQHIADVGSSGYSTGPHLHFEYYKPGVRPGDVYSASNPAAFLNSLGLTL